MANYLTSPRGATSNETNKESLARIFGVKKSDIGVLNTSVAIDSYSILYDKTSCKAFYRGAATGTPTSWSVSNEVMTLVTSAGTYTLYSASKEYLGDYAESTVTLSSDKEYITYLGKEYRLKSSVSSYTTTGTTSTTWETDKDNFYETDLGSLLNNLSNYGEGDNTGLVSVDSTGTTLYDFVEDIQYHAGLVDPNFSTWKSGATSTYTTVWKWTDGTYWWGCNGTLPDSPNLYNMRRYNPFGDPVNINRILQNIFFQDRTASSTLWSQFISGVTNRIPISSNTTMFSGNGTMDSVLSIAPMLTLIGALTWPDYSLSGAPQLTTLSSSAASTYGTYANYWALSTPSALGVSTDTGVCSVWTGVTRAKRLYRLVITTTGHIFIRVMSADLTWGSSYELYSTLNTTKSSAGVLSAASPIVRIVDSVSSSTRTDLLEDTFEEAGDCGAVNHEAIGCTVSKVSTGTYKIVGCTSLATSGWQVKDPFALQGSTALGLAEGVSQDDGSVMVYLYKRKLVLDSETMEVTETKGDLIDVPEDSWIDVRVAMADITEEEDL